MQPATQTLISSDAKHDIGRFFTAAGVALTGAALIAGAPGVTPMLPNLQHQVRASAVRLTAGWDPLAAWSDAYDAVQKNGQQVVGNFLLAPGVGLQQAIVNQINFAKQLIADPSSFDAVAQQMLTNLQTVGSALTLAGLDASNPADKAILDTATKHTTSGLHGTVAGLISGFLPAGTDVAAVNSVVQFLESPLSGLVMGAIGPMVSPGVALLNSAQAISTALAAKDTNAALTALLDTPANMVGAFFNGADLNLNSLTSLVNGSGALPDGTTIDALDVAFGGLLTPGTTGGYTYDVKDVDGNVITSLASPGGSIFNSIGLTLTTDALGFPLTLPITSSAVGPIGALEGLSQTVGVLLGDGWDSQDSYPGWDGKGNPSQPTAPIFGLGNILDYTPPASTAAQSAAAASLHTMVQNAVAHFTAELKTVETNVANALKLPATSTAATPAATPVTTQLAAVKKTETTAELAADTSTPTDTGVSGTTAPADSTGTADKTDADKADTTKADTDKTGTTSSTKVKRNPLKGLKDAVKKLGTGSAGSEATSGNSQGSTTSGSSSSGSAGAGTHAHANAHAHKSASGSHSKSGKHGGSK